jgi:hypothetical protein
MLSINPKIYFPVWLITYGCIIAIAYSYRRRNKLTFEQILITAGFSSGSVFALLKVLVNLVNYHTELVEKLDWDGITALSISCLLGISLALKEIKKLF